jgi:hypothetical protein
MQIIFDNFPHSNGVRKAHVWNFNGDYLRWCDISKYIKEKTQVPLHYIKIRNPAKGLSHNIDMDLENEEIVNISDFQSTFVTGKNGEKESNFIDLWFDIRLNFFSKVNQNK